MRQYLATLHKKPDQHKKRFAFLVSGTFTLFLFVTWSLVNYGLPASEGSREQVVVQGSSREVEITPFNSLEGGMAAAFKALTGGFSEMKRGLEQVNVGSEY